MLADSSEPSYPVHNVLIALFVPEPNATHRLFAFYTSPLAARSSYAPSFSWRFDLDCFASPGLHPEIRKESQHIMTAWTFSALSESVRIYSTIPAADLCTWRSRPRACNHNGALCLRTSEFPALAAERR